MSFAFTSKEPKNAIETIALCKAYSAGNKNVKRALNDVTLTIPRGSFFGLLGPNGAGKSTFINILAGLVTRSSGTVRVWENDIDRQMCDARRSIGIVPQELNIDPFFTPRELLELYAGMYGVPTKRRRTNEILESVGLIDKADAYARTLSGGMRRRLLVAKAMVHAPKVLVLDEPTAGVDVDLRRQLWNHIRALHASGTTILLTTHYLEEAEQLCEHIAVINRGKLIACEPTQDLLSRMDAKELTITIVGEIETLPAALDSFHVELKNRCDLVFYYPPSQIRSGKILTAVQNAGLEIRDITSRQASLEDIFLKLTQNT